ncbi:ATP-dependent helicase [Microbacterium karelineae]|uniref:ATP-dependent helicase n=1 Tax=Microbacterium karelineae TaxID=2654283 RepID=UPI0012E9ED80|nr:ATP-dependent DNA helicase [Microbacterium karelineae]
MPQQTPWDPDQQAVLALAPDASGVVIGAPGSGKTSVLVERVARLVGGAAAAYGADQVLVLTPSRASATRLRDRLGVRIDVATPGPLARSVGSFAFQIVRGEAIAGGESSPELLTGAEQDRILAQIIEGDILDGRISWPEHLGPTVRRSRDFRSELRGFLDTAVELDASRDELSGLSEGAWAPVAALLAEYASVVQNLRTDALDAAELVSGAVRALREGRELPTIERLRVVLVDDAQELTRGGVALVEALRARGIAVLAAGDPDIASGAFRGVTPELFAGLASSLGGVQVLARQHRQSPELTWLVRRMTQAIGAGGSVEHRRAPGPEPAAWNDVAVMRAASSGEECDRIARRLRELHLMEGVPWGAMAVIAHDTRQLVALETELAARDVPTRAAGVPRPLGSERAVRQIMEIVRLGLTPAAQRDDEAVVDALRSPFGGFTGVALRRLRGGLRHAELADGGARPARELLREAFAHPALFAPLDTAEGRSAERFATTLREVGEMGARGATVHELLWHVWDRARGLDGRRLSDVWRRIATSSGPTSGEVARALDGLVSLFDAAKRSIERDPHDGPQRFLREILDSDVPEDSLSAPERGATVSLLTPANALSTEFEVVVIAGLQDGVWPNTRLRGGLLGSWRLPGALLAAREGHDPSDGLDQLDRRRQALHDELRLFVRALSRARSRLIVTAVDDDDGAPSPLLAYLPPEEPAEAESDHPLTLRGLVARHRRVLTTSDDPGARAEAAGQLRILADSGVPGADPDEWYGVRPASTTAPLRDLEREPVRVSPSQIDGFEECGLSWAIAALGGDSITSPSAGLGTLLHAALERVPDGGIDAMRAVVDERWGELDFETAWIRSRERRRIDEYIENLDDYLARTRAEGGRVVASEAPFRFAIALDEEDDADARIVTGDDLSGPQRAVISGVIDRVETYPRGAGEHAPARGRGFEAMRAADGDALERVVVADLKSGKGEARLSDDKVADDAQLAAYQIAVESGLIEGADARAVAGARLIVVSKGLRSSRYRVAHQHLLAGEARAAFLRRVAEAARGMSASSFQASAESHCRGGMFAPVCRIHTIGAVSA